MLLSVLAYSVSCATTSSISEAGDSVKTLDGLFGGIRLTQGYKEIGNANPLMTQRFSADPWALVYDGRVYVYTTNDVLEENALGNLVNNGYGTIRTLNCISSADLANWTDHGTIKVGGSEGVARWASNSWAPAVACKKESGQDRFFLYFSNSASSIGVLASDGPTGPWIDPLGKPLIAKSTPNCFDIVWLFDPAVLTDDDGKSFLYFGGGVPKGMEENPGTARMVELGDDMTSLAGTPEVIDAPFLFEDSGINKIGSKYCYSYCSSWSSRDKAVGPYKPDAAAIIYMTGDGPLGPWAYQGSILKNPGTYFGCYGNNHHSIVNFLGNWYVFYHSEILRADMKLSANGYRCVQADEIAVLRDGSIAPAGMTRKGVKQVRNFDPFIGNEAETIAWMGGISTRQYPDGRITVYDIDTGDWMGLSKVDFGNEGATAFKASVSSTAENGVIKVCIDEPAGEAVGYVRVPNTGKSDVFDSVEIKTNRITGVHDLYFVFAGSGYEFDSWQFEE
jgi:arabinoxylan arabinofuranohydrolase